MVAFLTEKKKVLTFFLFLHESMYCGYILETPHQGTSVYPQLMFSWRNKKNSYLGTSLVLGYEDLKNKQNKQQTNKKGKKNKNKKKNNNNNKNNNNKKKKYILMSSADT